jgi:hypothetical protein
MKQAEFFEKEDKMEVMRNHQLGIICIPSAS